MADYSILVKAILQQTDLQRQIDAMAVGKPITIPIKIDSGQAVEQTEKVQTAINGAVSGKPIIIPIKAELDQSNIDTQLQLWQNKLTQMQVGKTDIFNTPEVKANLVELKTAMDSFVASGGKGAEQVNLAFSNLATSVKVGGENMKMMNQANADLIKNQNLMTSAQAQANKENVAYDAAFSKRSAAIQKFNMDLDSMAAKYPKAFNSKPVQDSVTALKSLNDGFQKGTVSADAYAVAQKSVTSNLEQQKVVAGETVGIFGSLTQTLNNALQKIMLWGAGTMLIYGTLNDIKKGITYIEDLNKAMTDTQVVSGATATQIAALADQYNKLATQLGSTTLEIASGNLEFIRAGYSAQESVRLLTASTIQSKLANMDAATSTDRMISTLHGFQLQTSDAMGVVDKLINLDNNFASSVNEISAALAESSSVAKNAGVTFDELAPYITVVSSVTRQSGADNW